MSSPKKFFQSQKAGVARSWRGFMRHERGTSTARTRLLLVATILTPITAAALLPPWLQHIRTGESFESALFRAMDLPGLRVLFPRPPAESVTELNKLPSTPALLSLRARQHEAALDFPAAESDWKAYAASAPDHAAALLELADYYHRRLAIQPELATLQQVATAPSPATDDFLPIAQQRSWQAFERLIALAGNQGLDDTTTLNLYRAWIARYPQQSVAYARAITWALAHQRFADADSILASYRTQFPADKVFPTRAAALIALRRGGSDAEARALAVYDSTFDPLWPQALTSSYFSLLDSTRNLRHFLSDANTRLARNPDDLNALGRIFAYNIAQQHPEAAAAALDQYRRSKEARNATWSPAELSTLSQLALTANDAPLAARYDFALYHATGTLPDGQPAAQVGLANMVALLLKHADKPIALGSGNLSMYRDIATLDQGPGLWNGVLSLWFNGQSPNNEFAAEESKAQSYFHFSKAAELLAILDKQAPNAPQRLTLHAQLLQAYAAYGDDKALLAEGAALLTQFPNADADFRTSISFSMADAYARHNDEASEFALYDHLLSELTQRTKNMPLTTASLTPALKSASDSTDTADTTTQKTPVANSKAFELETGEPTPTPHPDATAYAQVLDRYLGRLTAAKKLPEALAVLRKELDRNPNDPALYEKLADFLGQNNMTAQQEQVYQRAIDKFQTTAWTDKLARLYLRTKRNQDFATLTRKVVDTFEGTDVDSYFRANNGGGQQLFVQLNLYAHQRFPHDEVFTNNLLTAYSNKPTTDRIAYEKLLRETWWQSPQLTQRFFEFLSSSGKLDSELAALKPADDNPAATREAAEANLWLSHHELSAPLFDKLAAQYPADTEVATTASDLERSLAWFDLSHIHTAVAIEDNLLRAHPGDTALLARIGDILADHANDSAASLASSAAYWRRIPQTAPGDSNSYLTSATVFWDYFQFDDALAQIAAARTHLHQPALFAYEAGAVAEGKRDYALAISEYINAALDPENQVDDATPRLVQLARRPELHDAVEKATIAAVSRTGGPALRVNVLTTQHRKPEAATLLDKSIQSAKTAGDAATLAELANHNGFQPAYEQALARQAELTTDPVERIQLRYQLAQQYEQRNDIADAARLIDSIYHDNPMLLGVVRSTVDFDWRNNRKPQAITVLVSAGRSAQQPLANQLIAEAAAKANDSGDTTQARTLALQLLHDDPYNPLYLSLAAGSYSRANDLAGLKAFYLQQLDSLHTAQLDPATRKDRTALLRRGLIPALTSSKDYDGAMQQYIALLSVYPEDTGLISEAAFYAQRYDRRQPLLDFLHTTNKASPQDSRFFVTLAQTQAIFGDRPAAIDAYAHAITIRKDRTDLYQAKASLEETTQRFDEAFADYQRLYVLTYKNRDWMIAAARVRARQGRADEATAALRTAFLTGPKHTPHDYFQVAAQLEQWDFLPQSASAAEEGHTAAGSHFLVSDSDANVAPEDPATYARILTRQRNAAAAMATLRKDFASATVTAHSPSVIVAKVKAEGVDAVADSDGREQEAESRNQRATTAFNSALAAMGAAVDTYYTPEERTTFAALLETLRTGATPKQLASVWIPAANAAHLQEKEAAWRKELLLTKGDTALEQLAPYTELERRRLRFTELATTLEAFTRLHPTESEAALTEAADAYRDAGDGPAEARVLRTLVLSAKDNTALQQRYLSLLARRNPAALVTVAAGRNETLADAAVNTALARARPETALAAITARGKALPAVWTPATTGLAQLYLANDAAESTLSTVLLPNATIAERLGSKADPRQTLTGELWFYYAARAAQPHANEDLLAADLEYASTSANYSALAQTYAEAHNPAAALAELDHALELDPHDASAQDVRALILWNANRHPEAVESWRAALASLRVIEDRSAAPEAFWSTFIRIASRVRQYGLYEQLKPQMDDVLRIYIKRNGDYRSTELLRAAILSAPNATEGTQWIVSLTSAAIDPATVLDQLASSTQLPAATRIALLQEELRALHNKPAATRDSPGTYQIQSAQTSLLNLYQQQHRDQDGLALIRSLDSSDRNNAQSQHLELVFSARTGQLPALLHRYDTDPDNAPSADTLQSAAADLLSDNRPDQARAILEFSFTRAVANHTATSTQYLALAELRLRTNDLPGALALLQSLTQTDGDLYTNLDSAAALLEKNGHAADAVVFLKPLAAGVPWDLSYAVRLAEAQRSAPDSTTKLTSIAKNSQAPYAIRVRAARALSGTPSADLGSAELNLLTHTITPESARQPYFVAARTAAAAQLHDSRQQAALLREAVAIAPPTPQVLLDLFRAEAAAKEIPTALAALNALRNTTYTPDTDATTEDTGDNSYSGSGLLPPFALTLPNPEQARLADTIAAVYTASGDTRSAVQFLGLSITLNPSGAAAAKAQIASIRTAQRLEAANAQRRPQFHKDLAQPNVVRARLTTPPDDPSLNKEDE